MKVRTRYAPSPTGYMHIGNLRTAIFEYLLAKKYNGDFILRIEDTDQEREVEGAVDFIYNTLDLCGFKIDEGPNNEKGYGPYIQSKRKAIYKEYALKLVEMGKAYYCFCSEEELTAMREKADARHKPFLYDGRCSRLSKEKIEENLTYDYLHSSEDNLWSILYLTGYLTRVRETDIQETIPDGTTALMIPNREIKDIFESTIIKWFNESTKRWNRTELFHAVWDGNSDRITDEMNKLLRKTISYHDYREDFYHAFLAGIFTGAGYVVESNKEHGEGRSDVIVYDSENGQLALFEVKYSSTLDQMKQSCKKALAQIDEKMYAKEFEDSYDKILCYGIAFFKKRCLVYLKN